MGCFVPCGFADSLSCQSLGFLVEARYSTEPILEKKELINDYTSTHFEMYLFVIIPFDCPRREGCTPFYVQPQRVCFFKDILVRNSPNRVSILVILVSNWVWVLHSSLELFAMFSVFLKKLRSISSLLSIRPAIYIRLLSFTPFTIQSETIVHKAGDPGSSNILK